MKTNITININRGLNERLDKFLDGTGEKKQSYVEDAIENWMQVTAKEYRAKRERKAKLRGEQ